MTVLQEPPTDDQSVDSRGITEAFAKATASADQLTPEQYFRVAVEVLLRAPCRLLIFGAGNDTELYARCNVGGVTVVLEDDDAWLHRIEDVDCRVVRVRYTTRVADGIVASCPLPEGPLEPVLSNAWDIVFIDGPAGWRRHCPGRQQSIALAARVASQGATIFLHDAQRPLERACAKRYLPRPAELHGSKCLAVYRIRNANP